MKRGWVVLLAGSAVVLCTAFGDLQAAARKQGSPAGPDATSEERALVNKYCVTCHNQKAKTAGLTLDTLDLADPSAGAEVWEQGGRIGALRDDDEGETEQQVEDVRRFEPGKPPDEVRPRTHPRRTREMV